MSAKNQRITKKGFRYEILPSTESSPRRVKDHNEYCTLYNRLAELEDKIEKGIINIAKERNNKDELASKFIDSYNDSLKEFAEKLKEKFDEQKYFVF